MIPIKIEGLNFCYGEKIVLREINIAIEKPGFYVIVGPNGSGKTTLLKNISKLLVPTSGNIFIYGKEIRRISHKNMAKFVSFVPQRYEFRYPFSVEEVLAMGRYPYMSFLEFSYKEYAKIVKEVATSLGIDKLLKRPVTSLSGGQAQRVMIGKSLIQDTPIYLLDEPTNSLDIKYKIHILNHFKRLSDNKVIISTFHDLDLIGFYADEVIFLKDGKLFERGALEEAFNPKNIREVFDVDVIIEKRSKYLKMDINWEVIE